MKNASVAEIAREFARKGYALKVIKKIPKKLHIMKMILSIAKDVACAQKNAR